MEQTSLHDTNFLSFFKFGFLVISKKMFNFYIFLFLGSKLKKSFLFNATFPTQKFPLFTFKNEIESSHKDFLNLALMTLASLKVTNIPIKFSGGGREEGIPPSTKEIQKCI